MVQVLGLAQENAVSLGVLTDDIVGLADSLCSRLVDKSQNMVCHFKYHGILWMKV